MPDTPPGTPFAVGFAFRCGNLPKSIYATLRAIAEAEGATQRQVVVAGVVALSHLAQHDPATLRAVWEQTRVLAPGKAATVCP